MASFQTTTISDIVDDLNYSYLLPAIQREFVWDSNQMVDLFDSILREYPIGSFLFWKVSGEYAQERVKYKFVQDYIDEPTHPDELSEVTYHNKRYEDEFENPPNKMNLVLDGQQRLSTLFIGLRGTLTERGYRQRRDKVSSWSKKQLYLNVLSDPSEEKGGHRYEFEFKEPDPPMTIDEYWYRVGDILNVNNPTDEANDIREEVEDIDGITVTEAQKKTGVLQKNMNQLYMSINKSEVIPYFTETEENQDKVLDIFIRTNEGGTQLSKSDVLLSIATAEWQSGGEEVIAREEIQRLVDALNAHDARGGITFEPTYVLRGLMMCGDISSMSFSLENFTEQNLEKMKDIWMDGQYESAVIEAMDLLKSYGFTTSHIQSRMTQLPIVYYIYRNNPSLSWGSKEGRRNRTRMMYWLASMVITGEMNTAGTVQTIQSIRNTIQETNSDVFPLMEIEDTLNNYSKSMGFDDENLVRWFGTGNRSKKKQQVLLSLVYFPETATDQEEYEVDHIFPKSVLTQKTLVEDYGMDVLEAEEAERLSDSVGNIQLIKKSENRNKSDKLPGEWLKTRTGEYRDRHLIPEGDSLLQVNNFVSFVTEREESMKQDLMNKTPNTSDDYSGI